MIVGSTSHPMPRPRPSARSRERSDGPTRLLQQAEITGLTARATSLRTTHGSPSSKNDCQISAVEDREELLHLQPSPWSAADAADPACRTWWTSI
jgi:hypothetical protein